MAKMDKDEQQRLIDAIDALTQEDINAFMIDLSKRLGIYTDVDNPNAVSSGAESPVDYTVPPDADGQPGADE